jgi:4-hydroxy-tetrahydrodipicolinate synthase
MSVTPFNPDGTIWEEGLRLHLRRMVEAGCGVYLGSGGSGEGHALTLQDLRRVYEIGVEECKGRVPLCANPPEQRNARAMIATAREAIAAGVDMVQVYQVDGGHGMRATMPELDRYFRTVLDTIDHPVALSCHFYANTAPSASFYAALCRDYPRVQAMNAIGTPINYHVELIDSLPAHVGIYVGTRQILEGLPLGSAGYLAAEPNIAPYLCRAIVERYSQGDIVGCARDVAHLWRLAMVGARWSPSNSRWLKMALKVLSLPGGNGVLRPPYLLPDDSQLAEMGRLFGAMRLSEVEAQAKAYCKSLKS